MSVIAVLNMNDEFNLFGRKTYITGNVFETYPPIDDAPIQKSLEKDESSLALNESEQDEKKGSLLENAVLGTIVSAALGGIAYIAYGVAFAAATVATGGAFFVVAACAAVAAIATTIFTASAVLNDYQSGHVRTAKDFAGQLATVALKGAVTGGVIYGLAQSIPVASALLGADLAGIVSVSSPAVFSKGAALAGYFIMGCQIIRSGSETVSMGTGYNVVLEKIFGGDVDTYVEATTLLDTITASIIAVGGKNMHEKEGVSRESIIENSNKNTNPGFSGGNEGEQYLIDTFGGEQQVQIKTSLIYRYIDTTADNIAHESKVGYNRFTKAVIKGV